jgi:aminoglycoside phosphotransferase (APT) family kinase protein
MADKLANVDINVEVVHRLVLEQFPQWSDLPITPVRHQGNDNRTFRLGDDLAVRLPSHESYASGITKEDRFLPLLSEHLTVSVPTSVAAGSPNQEYPYAWSVRRWMVGEAPDREPDLDRGRFAHDLGAFLRELREVPADDGPVAGMHSFYRGCHPSVYGDQVQAALSELGDQVDVAACMAIWLNAVRSVWSSAPVWLHGDIAVGNLLTTQGQLSAVIDFGTCGVGDPACDLVIAWTFLAGDDREIFREAVELPADAWTRARGWALWKALITVTDPDSPEYQSQAYALAQLLAEPESV